MNALRKRNASILLPTHEANRVLPDLSLTCFSRFGGLRSLRSKLCGGLRARKDTTKRKPRQNTVLTPRPTLNSKEKREDF